MMTSRVRPQWLIAIQGNLYKGAYVHRLMGNARREHEPQYRRNRTHGRRVAELPAAGPVRWDDVCRVTSLACTNSVLEPNEYEALNAEWHDPMASMLPIVSHCLEIMADCDSCMTRVEEGGIPYVRADEEEEEAVQEFRHFLNKFKGAERRRVFRMAHAMNENGTETAFRTSEHGHPSADQDGLSANFQPRQKQAN